MRPVQLDDLFDATFTFEEDRVRSSKGDKLTFGLLSNTNAARCELAFHKLNDWSPTDWACALAGESGEACNLVKKLRRLDDADKDKDTPKERSVITRKIGEELADTVIYADLLSTRLGLKLGDEVRKKFNKVSRRRQVEILIP
jgi:NTP pyrophosphatase (non-canonical NTP hydrolase)